MTFLLLVAVIALVLTVGVLRAWFLTFRPSPSTPPPLTFKNRFLSFLKIPILFLIILPLSCIEMLVEGYFYSPKKNSKTNPPLLIIRDNS